jgi:hypothetical protein
LRRLDDEDRDVVKVVLGMDALLVESVDPLVLLQKLTKILTGRYGTLPPIHSFGQIFVDFY